MLFPKLSLLACSLLITSACNEKYLSHIPGAFDAADMIDAATPSDANEMITAANVVVDDIDASTDWDGPIYQYGNAVTGTASAAAGVVSVTHHPIAKYHSVSMTKKYKASFKPNTWIHFRFRKMKSLTGADMYTDFYVDGVHIAEIGINGEQHWKQFTNCQAKNNDDEFFIGLLLAPTSKPNFAQPDDKNWLNDVRVSYPSGVAKPYTDWTVFSLKYEDALDGTEYGRRFRIFVDGSEITYRGIDNPPGGGYIDNHTRFIPKPGPNEIKVVFANFTDGDEYAGAMLPDGIRFRRCWAPFTPATPRYVGDSSPDVIPESSTMQWDWLIIGNGRSSLEKRGVVKNLMFSGRLGLTSSVVKTELLPWWEAEVNCPFMSAQEIADVRGSILGNPIFCPNR